MSDLRSDVGFSLIELMVALVIASIVAAFALPAYREHLMRSYVPEATSGLLLAGLRLEQAYQDRRSYRDGEVCGITLPTSERFVFRCETSADGQSFLLTATGNEGSVMQGFAYTLDQLGNARTTALPAGWGGLLPLNCWVVRRGVGC